MKQSITLFMFMLTGIAYSQTVTIDYEAWNPSNPPCRIFAGNTNVPAAGAPGGFLQHITSIGQPFYNTTIKCVQIETIYTLVGSSPIYKGGSFRIYYNFKDGYSYTIYVTAAAAENTVGNQSGPYFRIDVDNMTGGLASLAPCSGPDGVAPNLSGNPEARKLSDNAMQEFEFIMPNLGTKSTLNITAIPADNGGTKNVRIKKIRIVETPPAASFSISASQPSLNCGATTPITFTIANNSNTTGIAGYTWNIGTVPNGWLYNGSPAPATIPIVSTSLTSLSLTPDCGKSLSSISATITANGNIYNTTNSASISIIQPTYSIQGPNLLCTGNASYNINGLVCNSSILWTAPPASNATISDLTSSPTTLTYLGTSGNINLSANVTSCGVTNQVSPLPVRLGNYSSTDYVINCAQTIVGVPLYWCPNQVYTFSLSGNSSSNHNWPTPSGWTKLYQSGSMCTFRSPSGTNPATGSVTVSFTEPCGANVNVSKQLIYNNNGCSGIGIYTVSPNPANTSITVACVSQQSNCNISSIQIINALNGAILATQSWPNTNQQVQMNVSSIPIGPKIARINNGSQLFSIPFNIQR